MSDQNDIQMLDQIIDQEVKSRIANGISLNMNNVPLAREVAKRYAHYRVQVAEAERLQGLDHDEQLTQAINFVECVVAIFKEGMAANEIELAQDIVEKTMGTFDNLTAGHSNNELLPAALTIAHITLSTYKSAVKTDG